MTATVSVEDVETRLGAGIRARRSDARMTRAELADAANVSVGALAHLENGQGATTRTLAKVLRALNAVNWIDALTPSPQFNPFDVLADEQRRTRPGRVRHSKADKAGPKALDL